MTPIAPPVFYDLSEIFFASAGKLKIYGVIRVIAEIGMELARLDSKVRFVVYSPGHHAFFEVKPDFSHLYDGEYVDIGIPPEAAPRTFRSVFHQNKVWRRLAYMLAAPWVDLRNRKRWSRSGQPSQPADLTGAILVSASRPKFIVEYLRTLKRSNAFLVPMLHDLIPLHEAPNTSRYANFRGDNAAILRAAALVLTNSEFTRQEIDRFADKGILPRPKSAVAVPLAHECRESLMPAERPAPSGKYLLCVGSAIGRKNLQTVFRALQLLEKADRASEFVLVLAGAPNPRASAWLDQYGFESVRQKVRFFESPSHAELVNLYKHATCVVVPSKMEGWGLPAGEALWLGVPVICSSADALREAGAGLALHFATDSAPELAGLIEIMFSDETFVAAERQKINSENSCLRSWETVASELLHAVSPLSSSTGALLHIN